MSLSSVPKDPIDIEAALKRRGQSFASLGRKHGINRTVMSICVNHADKVRKVIEMALSEDPGPA